MNIKLSDEEINRLVGNAMRGLRFDIANSIKIPEEEIIRLVGNDINDAMRGWGFDIANSNKIPEEEKNSLIKAVYEWALHGREFTTRQHSLLYRIRNEYHIRRSSLYKEAIPESFWDKISNY
jgi:hypothetical protein